MSAYNELLEFLDENEVVEGIIFGDYGWTIYGKHNPYPDVVQRKLLTIEEAKPMMKDWVFYNGYGAPECFATNIWTNKRVIFVTQYDGSTNLNSVFRNPTECEPDMPGG